MISVAELEAHLNRLRGEHRSKLQTLHEMKDAVDSTQADVNAYIGAIQDCEFWLNKVREAEKLAAKEAKAADKEADLKAK